MAQNSELGFSFLLLQGLTKKEEAFLQSYLGYWGVDWKLAHLKERLLNPSSSQIVVITSWKKETIELICSWKKDFLCLGRADFPKRKQLYDLGVTRFLSLEDYSIPDLEIFQKTKPQETISLWGLSEKTKLEIGSVFRSFGYQICSDKELDSTILHIASPETEWERSKKNIQTIYLVEKNQELNSKIVKSVFLPKDQAWKYFLASLPLESTTEKKIPKNISLPPELDLEFTKSVGITKISYKERGNTIHDWSLLKNSWEDRIKIQYYRRMKDESSMQEKE